MALLKVLRAGQVTLPVELRKQFNLDVDGYVEAQVVKEGILLKPVSVVARKKAWDKVVKVLDRVHAKLPPSKKSSREQEEEIAQEIKRFRKRHAS
ncbi:MAG TPA: AbrB/MazE/SpoVT family DNA-binding domain-containing protein [Candidatus Binatia bacterium]|jgi:bifunctional DNA-binding transcriptional regulator/antitoxin component of YhaV-PrlF toxin-antitoxin module|nr:AbrB/MazE/SpoVT family DNA-binding domain-containing protein [Candidatus Binatia bacterium]